MMRRADSSTSRSIAKPMTPALLCLALIASSLPSRVLQAQAPPVAVMSTMTLRPGDALRVRISREPDLSGEFMVDEHGEVTLPRLGRRLVRGVPIDSVRARVTGDYSELLRDVTIELTPLYRVRVTGAVRNPGLYTADPTMTVADAVSLAGGVTPQGRNGAVSIMRDGALLPTSLSPASRLVELSLRSADELYVPERSWLSRNAGVAIGALSGAASLIWAIRR
jgi:protein involved in polysaccharide export with SLBB domain